MHKQTVLGAALAKALGNTSDVNASQAKDSKAKVAKVKLRDMDPIAYANASTAGLELMFNEERRVWIEEFAAISEDHRYSEETTRAEQTRLAGLIWPNGKASYNEVQAVGSFLRGISEYSYKSMIRAIKALPKMGGALPSKDGGKKSTTRATSPRIWYGSMAKKLANVRDQMAKCPKQDIDADVLRTFVAALKAIDTAERMLAKRIKAA